MGALRQDNHESFGRALKNGAVATAALLTLLFCAGRAAVTARAQGDTLAGSQQSAISSQPEKGGRKFLPG
jgi:hypothetical protein